MSRRATRCLLGSIGAVLATLASAPSASAAGYELERTWEVDAPTAMTVSDDSVYTTSSSTVTGTYVTRFTPNGDRVTSWTNGVDRPSGVAVDLLGNVQVTDEYRLDTFDPNGTYLGSSQILDGSGDPLFLSAIDVDPTGDRYITTVGSLADPPTVLRFSAAGGGLAAWGSEGAGDGQFQGGIDATSDGEGNVYVADGSNHRVQKFNDTGTYLGQWGQLGFAPGEFSVASAVALDERGDVYVADNVNGRIQR